MSRRPLSLEPLIDPTASVTDCSFGRYTAVGARTIMLESSLGDYSYVVNDSNIAHSKIGKFANIASQTRLNPSNHPMWRASLHHFTYRSSWYGFGEDDEEIFEWRRSQQVTLGHDTWIGHGVTIMPGVSVGTGAVVGSGAVVTKDVPAYAIAVGLPAKVLRYRFEPDVQEALLEIAWWDWPHDRLAQALMDFRRLDVREFVEKYRL